MRPVERTIATCVGAAGATKIELTASNECYATRNVKSAHILIHGSKRRFTAGVAAVLAAGIVRFLWDRATDVATTTKSVAAQAYPRVVDKAHRPGASEFLAYGSYQ